MMHPRHNEALYRAARKEIREHSSMSTETAIRALRCYFRRKAQHPDLCECPCCEAVEVLALAVKQEDS